VIVCGWDLSAWIFISCLYTVTCDRKGIQNLCIYPPPKKNASSFILKTNVDNTWDL